MKEGSLDLFHLMRATLGTLEFEMCDSGGGTDKVIWAYVHNNVSYEHIGFGGHRRQIDLRCNLLRSASTYHIVPSLLSPTVPTFPSEYARRVYTPPQVHSRHQQAPL